MTANKMALDALTAALAAMEHMANVLNNIDAVDEEEDAQHDAAFEAVRAAIAALQAEPQPANEREAALWRMVTANPQRAANLLSSWCDDGEATIEELEAAMAKD